MEVKRTEPSPPLRLSCSGIYYALVHYLKLGLYNFHAEIILKWVPLTNFRAERHNALAY
jgi:hypothetical protein